MSNITFQVIDTTCESSDQSFFPPRITMQTKSTTQIATVIGFPEYAGLESSPPKKYKTLTWNGTSEQQLWFPANSPGNPGPAYQIAGAKFEYSGSTTIDTHGNYLTLYSKNLSEMCNFTQDNLVTSFVPGINGGLTEYIFSGWFGPHSHQKCTPPGIPYAIVGDRAIGKGSAATLDSSGFWGSKDLPLSNVKVSDFNAISATQGFCLDSGGTPNDNTLITLFEPVPHNTLPNINNGNQGTLWFFGGIVWDHDYDSSLTDEYTDAEALSNAQVISGTGATAQNFPRTTGFISTFTNVLFTLFMSDLVSGQSYLASVEFADITAGTVSIRQYGISATGTTSTLTDIVPTPPAGHSIVVRNPKIIFSP